MDKVSLTLAVFAALAFLGGLLQAILAGIELIKHSAQSRQKKQWTTILIFSCLVLTLIFGFASYASMIKSNDSSASSNPGATSVSQSSPTATTASRPSPTATSANQVTPTALAADGTLSANKLLTCSTCSGGNDPIRFTVNTITIDNANGRTVWNATLNNISGNVYSVTNPGITLQLSSGTAQSVLATGYQSTYMNPGAKASIQFTFAFVPYIGQQYTFTAHLSTSDASVDMPFDPAYFTFPGGSSTIQIASDVTPTPLAVDGTLSVNKVLTCSTCSGGNDPIRFTINTITIDNANGRTVWNATLNNISGNVYSVTNPGITLQLSSGIAHSVLATGYQSTYMNPGTKASIQFIFAFVPYKGQQYTFTAHLGTSDASVNMPFDPVPFTF